MIVISDSVNTTRVLTHLVSTKPHEVSRNMSLMLKNEQKWVQGGFKKTT